MIVNKDCECFTHREVIFRNTFEVNGGKRGEGIESVSKASRETLGENEKKDIQSVSGKCRCGENLQFKV